MTAPPDIALWLIDLEDSGWDALAGTLSAAEAAKAGSYRTESLRQHYRRSRVALRHLLAQRTGVDAAGIELATGCYGKPELASGACQFNLSHSGQRALIGLTSGGAIGVDLEMAAGAGAGLADLVDMVCHPDERARMARLPEDDRAALFYRLWTRKEAYCKALGVGLALPFNGLRVGMREGEAAQVQDVHGATPWFVHPVPAIDGYAASVCVRQRHPLLTLQSLAAPAVV